MRLFFSVVRFWDYVIFLRSKLLRFCDILVISNVHPKTQNARNLGFTTFSIRHSKIHLLNNLYLQHHQVVITLLFTRLPFHFVAGITASNYTNNFTLCHYVQASTLHELRNKRQRTIENVCDSMEKPPSRTYRLAEGTHELAYTYLTRVIVFKRPRCTNYGTSGRESSSTPRNSSPSAHSSPRWMDTSCRMLGLCAL